MAELRLTGEQQQQLGNLLNQLAQDEGFRARLAAEPRAVLSDFGLGFLLPEGAGMEDIWVNVQEPEVAGYLHNDGHADQHYDGYADCHYDHHDDTPIFRLGLGAGLPSINVRRLR